MYLTGKIGLDSAASRLAWEPEDGAMNLLEVLELQKDFMKDLHLLVSQVVKDLQSNSDAASLEPVNIFSNCSVWKYRGEGNANVVVALQDVSSI